jgi:hypothetical protein
MSETLKTSDGTSLYVEVWGEVHLCSNSCDAENGRLVEIDGAGHGMYAGYDDRYNDALLEAVIQI